MITENLSTLKIHKLSQAQYERELAAGRIEENALYMTPDVNDALSRILSPEDYGISLPSAGTVGRIFFKKVVK